MSEVTSYLGKTNDLDQEVKGKVLSHLFEYKQKIDESISLTTSMLPSCEETTEESDSNSSDEENFPTKHTYCAPHVGNIEQQNSHIPLHCAQQKYSPGLIHLPTGVQVVLIPKDLLLKGSTCVQGQPNITKECSDSNVSASGCSTTNSLNQSNSSDSEPDSTVSGDTVIEMQVTANIVKSNETEHSQDMALDLSTQNIKRTQDHPDPNMWRPW